MTQNKENFIESQRKLLDLTTAIRDEFHKVIDQSVIYFPPEFVDPLRESDFKMSAIDFTNLLNEVVKGIRDDEDLDNLVTMYWRGTLREARNRILERFQRLFRVLINISTAYNNVQGKKLTYDLGRNRTDAEDSVGVMESLWHMRWSAVKNTNYEFDQIGFQVYSDDEVSIDFIEKDGDHSVYLITTKDENYTLHVRKWLWGVQGETTDRTHITREDLVAIIYAFGN